MLPRKSILLKFLVALSALSVSIRLNVPIYSISVGFTSKGMNVKIARVTPEPRQERSTIAAAPGAAPNAGVAGSASGAGVNAASEQKTAVVDAAKTADQGQKAEPSRGETHSASDSSEVKIEFMNIAPEGTSVLAGRATPGARVTVMENGTVVGTAIAGSDGDWSLATEHRFASKDPYASLSAEARLTPAPAPPGQEQSRVAEARDANPEPQTEKRDRTAMASPSGPAADLIKEFAGVVEAARREAGQTSNAPVRAAEGPAVRAAVENVTGEPVTASQKASREAAEPRVSANGPEPEAGTLSRSARAGGGPGLAVTAEPAPQLAVIPIPMQFVYREALLTEDGEKAVALLSEYLKLKKFDAITLSGHADERGGSEFNLELSRQRLAAIVLRLRKSGYVGAIKLEPKGESEPFTAVDRSRFSRDDLFQLDRRVELRVAR